MASKKVPSCSTLITEYNQSKLYDHKHAIKSAYEWTRNWQNFAQHRIMQYMFCVSFECDAAAEMLG